MNCLARGALPRISLLLLALAPLPASAQSLSLEEAWRLAEQANPALLSALAGRKALEGQAAEAAPFLWNNPEVAFEPSRRVSPQAGAPDQRTREWTIGLSQTFETGGQQGLRREAARLEMESLEGSLGELRRQLRADVEERFVRVLSLQHRIRLEQSNLELVQRAAEAMGRRVAAGEASRLEGNLAAVEAERTRNQLGSLGEALITARAELAQMLQLAPDRLPEAAGEVSRSTAYNRDALLRSVERRPQLATLETREQAARTRLELERAAVYPDVTLGVNAAREGAPDLRERIIGFSVSVPLPVFRRNQAGIGKAMGELTQAQIERQAAMRDSRAAVLAQWARVEQLRARVDRLRGAVLPPLEENLRLSQRGLSEGEIALPELLLVNRQVLEGRRDALEAETELRLAQIALERAAGWTQ
ncbi:MAG: TolC family protein [Betaproteobacteria bacterium]